MLIDWFTVVAQAVNFLILVWLMKRFLYQPILNALDAREKRIAGELADADARKAEATTEREEFRRKNKDFEQQRAALLDQATADAATERRRLQGEAQREADALRARLQAMLSSEFRNLHAEIARRTQAEVFEIARKTLADLAGTSLEARMVDVFVSRLRELDGDERERLVSLFKSPSAAVLVRSAFDLPVALRAKVEDAVRTTFRVEAPIRFEVLPHMTSGIELVTDGQKIAWSIADHLASLERDVSELMKAQHRQESGTTGQKSQ